MGMRLLLTAVVLFQIPEPYCSKAEDNCGNVVAAIIWFYSYYFFVTFILLNVLIGECQTECQTDWQTGWQTGWQTHGQTHGQMDKQTDRQTARWINGVNRQREMDWQKDSLKPRPSPGLETSRKKDRLIDAQISRYVTHCFSFPNSHFPNLTHINTTAVLLENFSIFYNEDDTALSHAVVKDFKQMWYYFDTHASVSAWKSALLLHRK